MTLVYQEHGIVRGLYRGMSINYIRAVPMTAVTFTAYEIMKQFFNMDTGFDKWISDYRLNYQNLLSDSIL